MQLQLRRSPSHDEEDDKNHLYPAMRAVSATLIQGVVGFLGSALWMASGGSFGFMMFGFSGCNGSFFAIEL